MKPVNHLFQTVKNYLAAMPPRESYRRGVYWATISLAALVLGLSSYHIQSISAQIQQEIGRQLEKRPWVNDYVVVDGRDIYLTGEIEPDSGIESEIAKIEQVRGVRRVTNVLSEFPRPTSHLRLQRDGSELIVSGRLSGAILEQVVTSIESSFVEVSVKDRISIDDRLGRPLWLEGFAQSLKALEPVRKFELNGWRDQIELTGIAADQQTSNAVGYSIPASLVEKVNVVNRLRLETASNYPEIAIVLDWSGSGISATVPSEQLRSRLIETVTQSFGVEQLDSDVRVDSNLGQDQQLNLLIRLLPTLNQVREFRLESTGQGYVVWGRVDDPVKLGRFLAARNQLGLGALLQNRIEISEPERGASVALFSDQSRVIVNGILPTARTKQQLFGHIVDILPLSEVIDLVSIEPNVGHSEWLSRWPGLLTGLPDGVIGITIDDRNLLLTGTVETRAQLAEFDTRISMLFPDTNTINWLTTTE